MSGFLQRRYIRRLLHYRFTWCTCSGGQWRSLSRAVVGSVVQLEDGPGGPGGILHMQVLHVQQRRVRRRRCSYSDMIRPDPGASEDGETIDQKYRLSTQGYKMPSVLQVTLCCKNVSFPHKQLSFKIHALGQLQRMRMTSMHSTYSSV
jgi:hypothetical protein